MSEKDERDDLERINDFIEYFENFTKTVELFADEAHINESYELEAPCRAAVYHTNTILSYIRSGKEGMLAEMPAEEAKKVPHLEIVKQRRTGEIKR